MTLTGPLPKREKNSGAQETYDNCIRANCIPSSGSAISPSSSWSRSRAAYWPISEYVSIGRVIAVKRRRGIGSQVLSEGIRTASEYFGADKIYLEAQVYAKSFYEKAGFRQVSDEFLEDGIPHIQMIREAEA